MELNNPTIKFNVGKSKVEFQIVHNLPETFGLDFNSALDNWLARTKEYTDISLVDYINDKMWGTQYFAMTMDVFNKANKV